MLLKSPGKVLEKSLNKRLSNLYEPCITGISIMENIKKKKKQSVRFSRADAFSSYSTTM